jgi:hypothetical protein
MPEYRKAPPTGRVDPDFMAGAIASLGFQSQIVEDAFHFLGGDTFHGYPRSVGLTVLPNLFSGAHIRYSVKRWFFLGAFPSSSTSTRGVMPIRAARGGFEW